MASCEVTEVNSGATFAIERSEIVLDGALAQGIALPHQCRGASCGTCKARVLEGEVDHGWSFGLALSDVEKAEGLCLLCQARPLSGTLRIQTLQMPELRIPAIVECEAAVLSSVSVTPRVKRVVLALPLSVSTDLPAGCYVEVAVPEVAPNRMYSLAAPFVRQTGLIELFVARHPHGCTSGFIHDRLGVGDVIRIRGPFGTCRLPDGSGPVLGLAGGTGIAPVLAIVEARMESGSVDDFLLVFSVREKREVFALDRLEALARRHRNFRYQVLVTDEASQYTPQPMLAPDWLRAHHASLSGHRGIVSGAPGFVEACVAACEALGMRRDDIATDSFTPVIPAAPLVYTELTGKAATSADSDR